MLCLLPVASWAEKDPSEVVIKDDQGRTVRDEEPGNVTEYFYNAKGRRARVESSRYGTRVFEYVPSEVMGPVASPRSILATTSAGSWLREYIYDTTGGRVLVFDGVDQSLRTYVLQSLAPYFWPDGLPPLELQALDPARANGFGTFSEVIEEKGKEIHRVKHFGYLYEVTETLLGEGRTEVSDNLGGRRIEVRERGWLLQAYDEHGPLLETRFDLLRRIESLVIGGGMILRYVYEDSGPAWAEKILLNEVDGKVMGRWRRADDFENIAKAKVPRPTVRAYSRQSPLIAEWDNYHYREGVVVINHSSSGNPYLLIPWQEATGQAAPSSATTGAWRSLSIRWGYNEGANRIDYNDTDLRLFITLGPANYASERDAIVTVARPRRQSPRSLEVPR
jgi:YD repeat-containing protein